MRKLSKQINFISDPNIIYLGLMKTRQSTTRQYGTDFGLPKYIMTVFWETTLQNFHDAAQSY